MALQIYIFKTGNSTYKVGVSRNVEKRRNQVQTGCPTRVDIFKTYEVPRAFEVETLIHNYFSDYSTGREWLEIPTDMVSRFLNEIDDAIQAANAGESLEQWEKGEGGLLDPFKIELRKQNFSERTVRSYVDWVRRFLKFHREKPREQLNLADLDSFLAGNTNLPSSSQRLARAALILFYELVLRMGVKSPVRQVGASVSVRRPHILTEGEIRRLLAKLPQPHRLVASLIYGSGLTLSECISLRLRDIDYEKSLIFVRKKSGQTERETILPTCLSDELKHSLREKYDGTEVTENCYLFPARIYKSTDRQPPPQRHLHLNSVQKALQEASRMAGLAESATCMMLRHSFAVHLLESGVDLKRVQRLLGHARIEQTTVYLELLRFTPLSPVSPLDDLLGHGD